MGVVQAKVKGFILLIQNDFLPLFEGSRRPSVQPCKSPDPDLAAKRAEWNKKQQRRWLAISGNSRFLIVPGSDHLSLLSNKEHAAVVSDAIIRTVHSFQRRR